MAVAVSDPSAECDCRVAVAVSDPSVVSVVSAEPAKQIQNYLLLLCVINSVGPFKKCLFVCG